MEKIELQTIAGLIDSLSFYQILKVSSLASEAEIREAFHREALEFHPDQYFSEEDPELQELSKKIYARVVEAYQTLSNREKRLQYDRKIRGSTAKENEVEDDIDEDAITSVRRKPSWATQAPGEKFFQLAQQAFNTRDYRSAHMNIQIALGTDSSNPRYQMLKERIESELKKQQQKN